MNNVRDTGKSWARGWCFGYDRIHWEALGGDQGPKLEATGGFDLSATFLSFFFFFSVVMREIPIVHLGVSYCYYYSTLLDRAGKERH